jgi:Domain of unknown function (DUF4190)/GYF domain 2
MYRILGADGKVYGPISAEQLRQWIAENRANAATYALPEGAPEWKPLGTIPEFSILFAAKPPAVPLATDPPYAPKNTGFATTGMILGIFSLTCGLCCYGFPSNVIGLIFSIIALIQIRTNPERYGGKGMAIAGLVLCLVSMALMVLLLIIAGIGSILEPASRHGYRL